MGLLGEYVDVMPDEVKDRIIRAQEWGPHREGPRCMPWPCRARGGVRKPPLARGEARRVAGPLRAHPPLRSAVVEASAASVRARRRNPPRGRADQTARGGRELNQRWP